MKTTNFTKTELLKDVMDEVLLVLEGDLAFWTKEGYPEVAEDESIKALIALLK